MVTTILVADAMTRSPLSTVSTALIFEASKKMVAGNVGSLVVVEKNKLVGILTKTDVIRQVVLKGKDPKKTRVGDVMARNIVSTPSHTPLAKATQTMVSLGFRRLPVVDNGVFVGLITQTDVLRVQPTLIELLADKFMNDTSSDVRRMDNVKGVCDACGKASFLKSYEGSMLCLSCLSAVQ
ncbi:hypothetical protein COT72_00455 [archaeon CG10_big_fil_rev_8_21_14_0_10_43_11]|nr:MAG: hypothetical protein COT72_00455 [archaeon CG10_big_fil_rev_8_21_14_0_10_43_11]